MKLEITTLTIFQNVTLILSIVVDFLIVIDLFNFDNRTIIIVFTINIDINIDQKYIISIDIIIYNTKSFVVVLIKVIEFYFNF